MKTGALGTGQFAYSLQVLYTLMAVYVHFNRFIDLTINSLTNPYNLPFQWAVVSRGAFWF